MTAAQSRVLERIGLGDQWNEIRNQMQTHSAAAVMSVVKALESLPIDERLNASTMLFGEEASRALNPLLVNAELLERVLDRIPEIAAAAGSMNVEYLALSQDVLDNWQRVKNALAMRSQAPGDEMLDHINNGLRGTLDLLEQLDERVTVFDKIGVMWSGFMKGLDADEGGLKKFRKAFDWLIFDSNGTAGQDPGERLAGIFRRTQQWGENVAGVFERVASAAERVKTFFIWLADNELVAVDMDKLITWPEPPAWLTRWMDKEKPIEIADAPISKAEGFADLPADRQQAVAEIDVLKDRGPLPTDARLQRLQAQVERADANVAQLQYEFCKLPVGPGWQAEARRQPIEMELSAARQDLDTVTEKFEEAKARADQLKTAMIAAGDTEAKPVVDTTSIERALNLNTRLSANMDRLGPRAP